MLVRAGLGNSGLGLAAGVVSYGAATLAVCLILLLPMARRDAAGIKPESIKWLAWIGITVCLSQIFMYCAMAIAPVTMVQPLMRISIIFGVIFSWMMNRDHEVFDTSVAVAVAVAVTGAISISIDPEIVLNALGSPDWLRELLGWHWPSAV